MNDQLCYNVTFHFFVFVFSTDEDVTNAVELKVGDEISKRKELKEEQLRFRYAILKRAVQVNILI